MICVLHSMSIREGSEKDGCADVRLYVFPLWLLMNGISVMKIREKRNEEREVLALPYWEERSFNYVIVMRLIMINTITLLQPAGERRL